MAEEGTRLEKLKHPGEDLSVKGKTGKIVVEQWHTGDDIRISVFNKEGNSVYFATDSKGAREWGSALRLEDEGETAKIAANRAVAEISKVGNRYVIEAYDAQHPGKRTKASFDEEQAKQITRILGVGEE